MKKLFWCLTLILLSTVFVACKQNKVIKIEPIVLTTPERPMGQNDVIQLATPKLDTVRVGFIGLGMRYSGAVTRFTHIPGTQIKALCDIRQECVENAQKILKNAGAGLKLQLIMEMVMLGKKCVSVMILI